MVSLESQKLGIIMKTDKELEIGRLEGTYSPDPDKEFISSHHCYKSQDKNCQERAWREGMIRNCAICKDKNPLFS